MKRTLWISLCALALIAIACEGEKSTKEKGAEKEKPAPEPPKPYTGPMTHDRMAGAGDLVHPFDPWEEALAKIQGQLGAPTKVEGDEHMWVFVDEEMKGCSTFSAEKMKVEGGGFAVGTTASTEDPITPERAQEWKRCLELTGKTPPEDPNVPGPPEDGSPTTVDALRTGVEKAPSKWLGKKVKLSGVLNSTSTAKGTGSDKAFVTISVGASKDDLMNTVGCSLADPAGKPAEGTMQGDAITVEGTVADTFGGGLDACAIVANPAGEEAPE